MYFLRGQVCTSEAVLLVLLLSSPLSLVLMTINLVLSIGVVLQALATGGFIAGNFPPGKMFHFSLAGQVLLNLLKAHCQAYTAVKALPNASGTKFGLTHAMWKFRTAGQGLLYLPAT